MSDSAELFDSMSMPLEGLPPSASSPQKSPARRKRRRSGTGLSLFWRTFFLLALMLLGSALAW